MQQHMPGAGGSPPHSLETCPAGQHFAQMDRNSSGLIPSVGLFAESGLRQGGRVVLFVTSATHEAIWQRLITGGFNPEALERSGQLAIRDAHATLNRFMVDNVPDWAEVHRTIVTALDEHKEFRGGGTRVYSELVDVLWSRGAEQAGITIEEFLNVLAHYYPYSMFCGHTIDPYAPRSYAVGLRTIGRTHDFIIPSEEDDRFQVAVDSASKEIFGIPLTEVLTRRPLVGNVGLPVGQRTMLWIMDSAPIKGTLLLDKARQFRSAMDMQTPASPANSNESEAKVVEAPSTSPPRSSQPVFIIDDDDDFRESLVELLEDQHIPVLSAKSAVEALDRLREGLRPSLILLDLHMDEMNGLQFREEQKKSSELADLPVVLITATARQDERFTGFEGCLRKPVALEDLRPALSRYRG
jgi:CheY-like chemotaxis protein